MNKRIISLILSIVMILLIIPPATYSAQAASFESELRSKGFPESYIPSLLALHEKYPKWNFEALKVGENFSTSVSKERQNGGHAQQRIQQYSGNDGKGYYCTCSSCYVNGKYVVCESPNWVAASQSAVEYYLDPRNFLNEEYIFQFESTEYNANHTLEGVEYILKGTWLYNTNITYKDASGKEITYKNSSGNAVKYSTAIMEAAKYSNMSSYYLASKIKQEVGGVPRDQVGGASGTNATYPGIYNFYNIGANSGALDGLKWAATVPDRWVTNETCRLRQGPSTSTAELVMLPVNTQVTYIATTAKQADGYKWINVSVTYSGKAYTGYIREDLLTHYTTDEYNRPWTDPYLSIYNGAKWIANNFDTQFTGYLQKFNVNPASGSSMHAHEYMTNVRGAADEASHTYAAYKNLNLLSDSMTFVIPVFENMPTGSDLETPGGITVSNTATGVNISWNSVPMAEKFRVYYKTGSGSWTKIADTSSTSYTWTGAASGTTYTFTVRCVSNDGKSFTSGYDSTGKSIKYIAAPAISSLESNTSGVKITWGKVNGAELYRVYYKNNSGGWTKIADTTSTSYTWTGAKEGTNYTFTIRCLTGDGKSFTSGFDGTGKSIAFLSSPKLTSVSVENSGTVIKWNSVTGAEKYRVYYKTGSGSWTKIADTTSTSYTWTGAASGTAYTFTVRCLTSDGKFFTSGFDSTGKSIKCLSAPTVSSVANAETGVKIDWGKVSGADKYRVYYKTDSGSWTKIADTTSTSYTWTGAKSGTNYTFTVRCLTSDGSTFTSGYDAKGKSIKYVAAPAISSLENVASGVKITWGAVSGAELYRVYYKNSSGGWTKIADTTSASYTWAGANSGTNYTFTIRCLTSDGKSFTSGYNSTGKSIKYIAAPKISSLSSTSAGVVISWGKVTGAEKYRVYYKTGSGSWTKIADTTSTSYTWTGAKSGTKYTFTVRCISSDGKSFTSGYDSTGKSITV